MGLPVSPNIANLYMKGFEVKAITSAPHSPRVVMRYVDDTFVVINKDHAQQFTDHINSLNQHIKFTNDPETEGTLPYLDTLAKRLADGSLKVNVYRKPTHTEQYLSFEHKLSVIRTLFHRAETEHQVSEKEHVKSALWRCGYENWSFKRACTKKQQKVATETDSSKSTTKKTFVVAPYVQRVSEKVKRVFSNYGISTCFKPYQTLRQLLVAPKDKTKVQEQSGVVYRIPCEGCNKLYGGETKRTLGERVKEHAANIANHLSAVAEHHQKTGHKPDLDNIKVLRREDKLILRKVREAIFIRKETSPALNRDGGRELSKIYDSLLETRRSRTPSTASSRSESVSQLSGTIR